MLHGTGDFAQTVLEFGLDLGRPLLRCPPFHVGLHGELHHVLSDALVTR